MSYLEWSSELDIGVHAMNSEHQVLIALMNDVYELNEQNAMRTTLGAKIAELVEYTKTHFAHEERYMESIGYKTLSAHRRIHVQLLETLSGHVDDFKAGGDLTPKFFTFLKLWLTAHIQGIDSKYGPAKRVA